MLKAQVTYLKKMPGGEQFSSEQFFCGLEAELADEVSAQTEALQARLRTMYAEATKSVDEQVALFHGKNGNGNGGNLSAEASPKAGGHGQKAEGSRQQEKPQASSDVKFDTRQAPASIPAAAQPPTDQTPNRPARSSMPSTSPVRNATGA
jgi:hypothetical protein